MQFYNKNFITCVFSLIWTLLCILSCKLITKCLIDGIRLSNLTVSNASHEYTYTSSLFLVVGFYGFWPNAKWWRVGLRWFLSSIRIITLLFRLRLAREQKHIEDVSDFTLQLFVRDMSFSLLWLDSCTFEMLSALLIE